MKSNLLLLCAAQKIAYNIKDNPSAPVFKKESISPDSEFSLVVNNDSKSTPLTPKESILVSSSTQENLESDLKIGETGSEPTNSQAFLGLESASNKIEQLNSTESGFSSSSLSAPSSSSLFPIFIYKEGDIDPVNFKSQIGIPYPSGLRGVGKANNQNVFFFAKGVIYLFFHEETKNYYIGITTTGKHRINLHKTRIIRYFDYFSKDPIILIPPILNSPYMRMVADIINTKKVIFYVYFLDIIENTLIERLKREDF